MKNKNIIFCGVGGQGTVLASKLVAAAAMNAEMEVKSAETIGMAQRGGSVFSYVRFGQDIATPMITQGEADIIIGFEPGEAVRMLPYLKKGGTVIVSSASVMPVTAALTSSDYSGAPMLDYLKTKVENLVVVDTDAACKSLGSSKVANMVLLGAAAKSGALGLELDDIKKAVLQKVKPQFHELNMKALDFE